MDIFTFPAYFQTEIEDVLTFPTGPIAVQYAVYMLRGIGIGSRLALTGLSADSDQLFRGNILQTMHDEGFAAPGAPIGQTLGAFVVWETKDGLANSKKLRHNATQVKIVQEGKVAATHTRFPHSPYLGHVDMLRCSNSRAGHNARGDLLG